MHTTLLCLLMLAVSILGKPCVYPYCKYVLPYRNTPCWPGPCCGKFMCGGFSKMADIVCLETDRVCDGRADCPDASDEKTCRSRPKCEDSMMCKGGHTCAIPCNKIKECPAGDDEEACPFRCPVDQYQCSGQEKCINLDQVCDGRGDCSMGEDEDNCEPKCYESNRILCSDKKTCAVPCNGVSECKTTTEDEDGCPFVCGKGQYRCRGEKKCLSMAQVCDGEAQCEQEDDEAGCVEDVQCPLGWYRFRESCYLFSGESKETYDWALFSCGTRSYALVDIHDAEESAFLAQLSQGYESLWIALTDTATEGTFIWFTTKGEPVYTDWAFNEPANNDPRLDCVILDKDDNYQWATALCNVERPYVCKIPL